MSKMLLATTDFPDELYGCDGLPDAKYLDDLAAYLASLGVQRWQWILCQRRLLDKGYPGGFDLLAAACRAAHDHGLQLHAVLKPFEGCTGLPLPPSLPRPAGVPLVDQLGGPLAECDPWLAARPQLRYARRPGDEDPGTAVAAIELIQKDDRPAGLSKDDLSLWTSTVNGDYRRHEGDFDLQERSAWQPGFPRHYRGRVLRLAGLNIPAAQRYISVHCRQRAQAGFTNGLHDLVRLRDAAGAIIPHTPGVPQASQPHALQRRLGVWRQIVPYFRQPQVQEALADAEQVARHFAGTYRYGSQGPDVSWTLDQEGSIGLARGKNPYLPGALHPSYDRVRQYWLSWVDFCIERGCDGVNIRATNHSDRSDEKDHYGFNEPVLAACGGRVDRDAAARVSGEAYSQFLRAARRRLKKHGRSMGVHVETIMLAEDERHVKVSSLPPNTDWQWRHWIQDIADYVEIRGGWRHRQATHNYCVDRISAVAAEAGKPAFYQSTIKEMKNVWRHEPGATGRIEWEMEYARRHPRLAGYVLYETAAYTRGVDGTFQGSPVLGPLVQKHFSAH